MPASLQSGEDDDDDDDDDGRAKWLQDIADAMAVLIAPHGKSINDIKAMDDEEVAEYHEKIAADRHLGAVRIKEIYQEFCVHEPQTLTTKKDRLGWLIATLRGKAHHA